MIASRVNPGDTLDLILEVEKHKDTLVEKVEVFLTNQPPVTATQLQNLLRLASETTSPKEVLSFIKYQIGREPHDKPEKWKWRKENFGERLIQILEGEVLILHEDKRVKVRLMRLFLGYLRRQAVYLGPPSEEEERE